MKRLIYWLVAIALVMAMVWGLRAYFLHRLTYRPEWYREQLSAGEELPPATDLSEPAAAAIPPLAPGRGTTSAGAGNAARSTQTRQPSAPISGQVGRSGAEISGRAAETESPLQRQLRENGSVRVAAAELVPLLLEEMRGSDEFNPRSVVRGAKSTLSPGRMVVEMILDLEKLPQERLTPDGVKIFHKVKALLPASTLNEVYVKGDLRPQVVGEQLLFGKASTVSIGKMTFDLEQLQKQFNIQPRVDLDHFSFRQISLEQGYLVLKR